MVAELLFIGVKYFPSAIKSLMQSTAPDFDLDQGRVSAQKRRIFRDLRASLMNPRLQWSILILLILIAVAYATYASRAKGPCTVNPQAVDCYHPPTN